MEYIKKFVAECRVYFAIGWYDAFGVGYRIYIFFLLPKLVVHGRECNFCEVSFIVLLLLVLWLR